jgi:hypothetical protein
MVFVMTSKTQNDRIPGLVEDISSTSSAFSQVAGILGGFSVTLVVLALSPGVISSNFGKDWVIGLILFSASLYILSSSYFANAISYEDKIIKTKIYVFTLRFFHLSNFLLSIGLLIFIFQFSLVISKIVAVLITVCASYIAFTNWTSREGRKKPRTNGDSEPSRAPIPILAGLCTRATNLRRDNERGEGRQESGEYGD